MTRERLSTSSFEETTPTVFSSRRRRRFPAAALAALALVGMFEVGFVWGNRYRFWDANYILLEKKREAMTAPSPPDDIAILGSSRFYHLEPARIKEVIGKDKKVTNYAWGWCGLETYEGVLRSLIQAGRTPKVILVDGIPEIFGYPDNLMTISKNDAFRIGFTETVPFGGAIRTTIGLKEWESTWKILTYYMIPPSARYRDRVLRGLRWLKANKNLPPLPVDYNKLVDAWKQNGYFIFPSPPSRVATHEEFVALEKATGPYIDRENENLARIFERFLKLANEHNVKVVMLGVPNNPIVFDKYHDQGIYGHYDKWLSRLERKYSNFSAPPPRWFMWPGLLGDTLHVNETGCEKFMQQTVELLSQFAGTKD